MRTSLRPVLFLAAVPVAVALLAWTGFLGNVRKNASDFLFSQRPAPTDTVIIAIDEGSLQAIGQWPWPRAVMAKAVAALQNARAIGIDVNYKETSRLGVADDQVLAKALAASRVPVVLASELQPDGRVIGPIASLASVSASGLANLAIDSDGTARTVQLSRAGQPTLAARVAGLTHPPDQPVIINYLGPQGTVPTYPFLDLIAGKIPPRELTNKLIFIGATARDLQDYRTTPLGLLSGVEIQATIAHNALHADFLKSVLWLDVILTLVAGGLALALTLSPRRLWLILVGLTLLILIIWIGIFIAFERGILLDILMPTLAVVTGASAAFLARYLQTSHERKFIHDTFSRYLAPQVIETLIQNPALVRLGGERRELTILFSDIRGFTTLSEKMEPQELSQFLNRYLETMTNIILNQQGVVDKYIGDAIMAFWGAPLQNNRQALDGVLAALAMVASLEQFNRENQKEGVPEIKIGIGLNTGLVTVGNMGSQKRFDYTAIGDEVNLASRLESLTKSYGVNLIISENTLARIAPEDLQKHAIVTREIDRVRVKGKTKPATIFEVIPTARAEKLALHLDLFTAARTHYYAGQWPQAIEKLEQFIQTGGPDGPAQTLLERCQGFLNHPQEGWDGVFEMKTK